MTILDSTSFVSPELIELLNEDGPLLDHSLNTMSGYKTHAKGQVITGLRAQGIGEDASYDLPPLLSNSFIPNCVSEVASPKIVGSCEHIKKFAKNFIDVDPTCSVHILLGRDSNDLLKTKCFGSHAPFVHKTLFGWALVGEVKGVMSDAEKTVLRTSIAVPEHFIANYELPSNNKNCQFPEIGDSLIRLPDDELPAYSQDDQKFNDIVSSGIRVSEEGFLEMPLPFKDSDVCMPNNKVAVYNRTCNTLERLKKSPDKLKECVATMDKYLRANHVEFIPVNEPSPLPGKVWAYLVKQESETFTTK